MKHRLPSVWAHGTQVAWTDLLVQVVGSAFGGKLQLPSAMAPQNCCELTALSTSSGHECKVKILRGQLPPHVLTRGTAAFVIMSPDLLKSCFVGIAQLE